MATNQWHPPYFKVMITLTTFKRLTLLQVAITDLQGPAVGREYLGSG